MGGVQIPYHLTREKGDLFGHYYSFSKRGDGLVMHKHTYEHEHNIIVLMGSVIIYGTEGPSGWSRTLAPGDVFDIEGDWEHEVQALEDNTLTLNLYLHGFPDDYLHLPDSEFSGATRPPMFRLDDGAVESAA
jgi:quercetin dioxygenase-like cupin family protein